MSKRTLPLIGGPSSGDAEPALSELFPISELPARLPKKKGKKISMWTALRWCISGVRGVKLRSLMIGKTRTTCDRWVLSFFQELTDGTGTPAKTPSAGDHQNAMRELQAMGV